MARRYDAWVMPAHVRDVTTAEFPQGVVARSKEVPVVVDFWATWCGPCRVLSPILERLAAEGNGDWELAKVDVDSNQQLAMEFGVQGIPTVVGFRDGEAVARFTGAVPEPSVKEWLRNLVPNEADRLAEQNLRAGEAGDLAAAERLFRQVLGTEPDHQAAVTGLAALLIADGRSDEAIEILARLPETGEVQRLLSMARTRQGDGDLDELQATVDGSPEDWGARLAYGRALAARARYSEALDQLLAVVDARAGDVSDEARQAMLDLFEVVDDAELVTSFRRRLANALF